MNDPSGSPTSVARTNPLTVNGTQQQISATVSINDKKQLPEPNGSSATDLFYDPTQPNADQYFHNVVFHELGHVYGLNDTPVPKDASGQDDYSSQPAGASIMNGAINTNDQGPHTDPATGNSVAGGVGASSVQPCDTQQINTANPPKSSPTPAPGAGNGKGGDGGGNGGGTTSCYDYDDYNDETNTVQITLAVLFRLSFLASFQ